MGDGDCRFVGTKQNRNGYRPHRGILRIVNAHALIDVPVGVAFFDVRQQLNNPIAMIPFGNVLNRPLLVDRAGRINAVRHFVVVHGDAQLREIVQALGSPRRFARGLNRRQHHAQLKCR